MPGWSHGKHLGFLTQRSAVWTHSPTAINYRQRISVIESLPKSAFLQLSITEVSQLDAFTGSYDRHSAVRFDLLLFQWCSPCFHFQRHPTKFCCSGPHRPPFDVQTHATLSRKGHIPSWGIVLGGSTGGFVAFVSSSSCGSTLISWIPNSCNPTKWGTHSFLRERFGASTWGTVASVASSSCGFSNWLWYKP